MSRWWLVLALLLPLPGLAHEVRPAYLQLHEVEAIGRYSLYEVLWKTPMRGELRLSLRPVFEGATEQVSPTVTRLTGSASVQTWRLKVADSLRGQGLRIDGLEATMTDTLMRIEFIDGSHWVTRLTPRNPGVTVPLRPSELGVAGDYLLLGGEHILLGIDHLLFVLALLLLSQGRWALIKTVTAFTIAHSITLALASLGWVHVPQAPVEAVIALSIVLVAVEILRLQRGQQGLTARAPWWVAFVFGLLHGFGFAGALSEIGLPQDHIPLALLFFNLGVEGGQLLFIAAVVVLVALLNRWGLLARGWISLIPPYAIGSLAMFWVIQRVAAF